jgi:hypothetical protein
MANRKLPLTRQATLEQEVRYVAAGNEEEQDDGPCQEEQCLAKRQVVLRAVQSYLWVQWCEPWIDAACTIKNGCQFLARRPRRLAGPQAHGDSRDPRLCTVDERQPDIGSLKPELWKNK